MLNKKCRGSAQSLLPLPDWSRKIEGDSTRQVWNTFQSNKYNRLCDVFFFFRKKLATIIETSSSPTMASMSKNFACKCSVMRSVTVLRALQSFKTGHISLRTNRSQNVMQGSYIHKKTIYVTWALKVVLPLSAFWYYNGLILLVTWGLTPTMSM